MVFRLIQAGAIEQSATCGWGSPKDDAIDHEDRGVDARAGIGGADQHPQLQRQWWRRGDDGGDVGHESRRGGTDEIRRLE